MKSFTIFFLLIFSLQLSAQENLVIESQDGSTFSFLSIDSPLTQIAGAPEPFFTYWWEFGDGHYSTLPNPKHTYTSKKDFNVLVALTNNYDEGPNRPTKKKKVGIGTGMSASLVPTTNYLASNESVGIEKNHDPKPNEEIIFVQTYKNLTSKNQKGTLLFFYNQKEFEKDHFVLADYRNHYNEKEVVITKNILMEKLDALESQEEFSSHFIDGNYYKTMLASTNEIEYSTAVIAAKDEDEVRTFNNIKSIKREIAESYELYRNVIAFEYNEMAAESERNLFMSFLTTNDMLKDTNVTINVQSIFIPNDYSLTTTVKHFMPIVTAHDPNKLIVDKSQTYRAFSKNNALEYEIKFQNVGKGPAEEVKLRFYNNADIDIKSIEILEFEPKCEICSENCKGSYIDTLVTKEYVEFYFHNIYLPGTRQADLESRDASKGFVKFKLQTEKKIKQNDLTCRTEIYFDKEDPIKTNNSKTKFQKRFYLGAEIGATYLPVSQPKADVFLRGTMTVRVLKNWYYRAEIGASYKPNSIDFNTSIDTSYYRDEGFIEIYDSAVLNPNPTPTIIDYDFSYIDKIIIKETTIKTQSVFLDIVPLEIRRDINSAINMGAGINTRLHLFSSTVMEQFINEENTSIGSFSIDTLIAPAGNTYYEAVPNYVSIKNDYQDKTKSTNYKVDVISGLFVDVNIGNIYSLPYFGIRANVDYNFTSRKVLPALQFYLGANF